MEQNKFQNEDQTETVIDSGIVESIHEAGQIAETSDLFNLQFLSEYSEQGETTEQCDIKISDYVAFKSYDDFQESFKDYQKSTMTAFCTCSVSKDFRKDGKCRQLNNVTN